MQNLKYFTENFFLKYEILLNQWFFIGPFSYRKGNKFTIDINFLNIYNNSTKY